MPGSSTTSKPLVGRSTHEDEGDMQQRKGETCNRELAKHSNADKHQHKHDKKAAMAPMRGNASKQARERRTEDGQREDIKRAAEP